MELQANSAAPTSPEQLLEYLGDLGIEHTTYTHEAVFTVEESKRVKAQTVGQGCKCLFLKDKKKGQLWLVATLDDKRVDLNTLSKILNCGRFSFGSPDKMMEFLGVIPGSVTPFGLFNDKTKMVQPILDMDFKETDFVNFHPLVNFMTTRVKPADLEKFIKSLGHNPLWVKVPEVAPAPLS